MYACDAFGRFRRENMTHKSFGTLVAVVWALAACPAMALDLSIGASLGASASGGSSGDDHAGGSVGLDLGFGALLPAALTRSGEDASGPAAGASGTSSTASTGSAVAADGDDPLLAVVSLINESNWTTTSFSSLSEVNASTYDVNAMLNGENSGALNAAIEANAGEIAELQAALSANAEFSAMLEAQGTAPSGVLTVGVTADGSLAVFVYE
jgi:hypothetical protein